MARAYQNYRRSGQQAPIPGREGQMVRNNAGGFGFILNDWERLHRFLILGSEGGTYYVHERNLTAQNADCVLRCLKADGRRVVQEAHNVNVEGRAPKVSSQLFVMALAMRHGNEETKQAAAQLLPAMLRTGTHLLNFVGMLDSMGGWNRSKRRIIKRWFNDRPAEALAYQLVKYQSRDGWAMRDALRMAHPNPPDDAHDSSYAWAVGKGAQKRHELPDILRTHMQMSDRLEEGQSEAILALYGIENGLPREALPNKALTEQRVLERLLPMTPPTALIRNLGNFSRHGLFDSQKMLHVAMAKLRDTETLKRHRVHPFTLLMALLVYERGHGVSSTGKWSPNSAICDALRDALDASFKYTSPTNKRICVGVDASSSMTTQRCVGAPLPAHIAASAVAYSLYKLEPHITTVIFDTDVIRIIDTGESKSLKIHDFIGGRGGGTNLAAPIEWALKQSWDFDAFILLTDNETWAGKSHAAQRLAEYRRTQVSTAKLICASMAANDATVVDPDDAGQLGISGLDTNLPILVNEFLGVRPLPALNFDEDAG
jgi:60 kDa SS-A/Ro ribonucleoprotein